MWARHLAATICAASIAAPAAGAECTFATAIYQQRETEYVLRFQPQERLDLFAGATNVFDLESPSGKETLSGRVMWNNGEGRPEGWLMKDCPEDGQTDEDYASCRHWRGVMYALVDGNAVVLPKEWEAPPARILLPDLGRALRYSALNYEDPPWDVFDFAGCGSDETK